MENKRVVVTGLGTITPLGHDVPSTWQAMLEGQSGVAPITQFDASQFKTQFAAEVKDFDPAVLFDRKEARKLDRYGQFTLWAAEEAFRDSALDLEREDRNRIGVIWGSGMGGLRTFEDEIGDYYRGGGTPRFSPFFLPKMLINLGAGQISLRYGLRGQSYGVTSACSSASHAIASAFDAIRHGRADIMFTGGADADITQGGIGSFNAMHALSTRNDSPETASRPFSASRDGFVMGEGAGCLILEEMEHARLRGAKIYAEVVGYGMTSDAYHMTAPDPEGNGAARVMLEAIHDGGAKPDDVDYINTHGTSTPLGDIAELNAIQRVFGDHAYELNISSTKSMTGHALGAAGAIEAVATIMAVHDNIVPPTINHEPGDEDENIDYRMNFTFNHSEARQVRCAISNTFGFGGHNACLMFRKYSE